MFSFDAQDMNKVAYLQLAESANPGIGEFIVFVLDPWLGCKYET